MSNVMGSPSRYDLDNHGLRNLNMEYWTMTTPALVERIVSRREGMLAHEGAVVVRTGNHTGRAANDKFIVQAGEASEKVNWGKINKPMSPEHFEQLYLRMTAYFQGRDIFVQDTSAVADPQAAPAHPGGDRERLAQLVCPQSFHALLRQRNQPALVPEYTILHAPGFRANPETDGTNSDIFIILELRAQDDPDRRDELRRRDEEIDLHRAQLPDAAAGRAAHALRCQRGHRTRTWPCSSGFRAQARPPWSLTRAAPDRR